MTGAPTPSGALEVAKLLEARADDSQTTTQHMLALYEYSAHSGMVEAQEKLAWLYVMGDHVEEDSAQAAFWFRQAANNGSAAAQYALAWRYMDGEGVPVDYSQARHWFELAASQNHIDAQNALGYLLHHGEAPLRNIVEAAHWYSEAARGNHMLAKGNLAELVREQPQINIEGVVILRDEPDSDAKEVARTQLGDPAYTLAVQKEWTAVLLKEQKQVGWIKNSDM